MTDEQAALLRNIRANPDDDLSRLVYADWLEERGDTPQAELIRFHIERDRLPTDSPRRFDLAIHTGMLLALHRDRWVSDLRQRFGITGVEFVRGIPEEVELPLVAFAAVSDELFATLPIRHVLFSGVAVLDELRRLTLPTEVMRSAAVTHEYAPRYWHREQVPTRIRYTFTVLNPKPARTEPLLNEGRWRILCPAVWSGPDLITERAFFEAFLSDPALATDGGGLNLAVRQFEHATEFARWCPVPDPHAGPHWIELENGQLVSHRRGLELPIAVGEDDEDVYDGDLE